MALLVTFGKANVLPLLAFVSLLWICEVRAPRLAANDPFAPSKPEVGGQAVLGRQLQTATPWLTERHGYDPTCAVGLREGEQVAVLGICKFALDLRGESASACS